MKFEKVEAVNLRTGRKAIPENVRKSFVKGIERNVKIGRMNEEILINLARNGRNVVGLTCADEGQTDNEIRSEIAAFVLNGDFDHELINVYKEKVENRKPRKKKSE